MSWASGSAGSTPSRFVAWSSLVAPLPMVGAVLSRWSRSARWRRLPTRVGGCCSASRSLAYGGTLFSYGLWARLLAKYPTGAVAPFALLVPVVGMASAALLFGEQPSPAELAGALVVMVGLAVNVFGARVGGACGGVSFPRKPGARGQPTCRRPWLPLRGDAGSKRASAPSARASTAASGRRR